MNNSAALVEDIEEVIQRENSFPVDLDAGGPFGVSERTSVLEVEKKIEGTIIPKESISRLWQKYESQLAGCNIVDEQLERWLSKLGEMPRNAYLLNNIGKIYLSKDDIETALKYFDKAIAVKDDFRPARANAIKAYILQEKLDEALAICLEGEKKHTGDINILMNLAHLYIRKGEIENAQKKLGEIITLDPENSAAHHNMGLTKLLHNRVNEAVASFRKATTLNERSAQSFNALGACYVLQSAYKKAIKYFIISHNLEKTNINILKNLAKTYQMARQFKEAAELMDKHLLDYPMDVEARDIIAFSYLNLKNYQRCIIHLNFQIQRQDELPLKDKDIARILNNIGVAHSSIGKFKEAITIYKSSIEMCDEPNIHIPYTNLMKVYIAQNRIKSAESLLKEYIGREIKNPSPMLIMASYYYDYDEYNKSCDLITQVIEKDGENIVALHFLSSIYSEAFENLDKSLELSKHAYNLKPSNPNLANSLAYVYARKGLAHEAREILGKQKWDRKYFFALATKGLVHIVEGDVREGARLYDEAEKLAWDTEWKRLVRQKKHVELARYYLMTNKLQEANRELGRALSVKPKKNIYKYQAERLLADLQQHQLIH